MRSGEAGSTLNGIRLGLCTGSDGPEQHPFAPPQKEQGKEKGRRLVTFASRVVRQPPQFMS